ncbi:fibrobacter succinogenes major paralogous domain-containing protein [Aquimarina algicola]|uniref:fibrobacter succinogenes major paralogous domain-containing protein n=1 Tax=Aquimarina algicola TaxID=2589995 RepID=UPI001CF439B9|nr:fibrobacter succinogenes major paralogous domain-containing protein [Aquimarina algicola]
MPNKLINTELGDIPEVSIGNQIWMSENLDVVKFRNGDKIRHIDENSHEQWEEAGKKGIPAWCYFGTDVVDSKVVYKKLYNWHAVNDPRGLAPEGWHIPNESEWEELENHLGGSNESTWNKLKSDKGWKFPKGTNESGFSALPGGIRSTETNFTGAGYDAVFWSSTEKNSYNAIGYHIEGGKRINLKESGFSVRCIKNKK